MISYKYLREKYNISRYRRRIWGEKLIDIACIEVNINIIWIVRLFDLEFPFLAETEDRLPVRAFDVSPSANEVLGGYDCGEEENV